MRERTRRDVVAALREIVREGGTPNAALVARRAGVAQRTLFDNFENLDGLYAAAVAEIASSFLVADLDLTGGAVPERLARFAGDRCPLLEEHVWLVALVHVRRSPAVLAAFEDLRAAMDADLGRRIGDLGLDAVVLDAMHAASGFAAWYHWRVVRRFPVDRATAAVHSTLTRLAIGSVPV